MVAGEFKYLGMRYLINVTKFIGSLLCNVLICQQCWKGTIYIRDMVKMQSGETSVYCQVASKNWTIKIARNNFKQNISLTEKFVFDGL